jgi:glycosyltransferase involved in cell wall biosynthesis
MGTSRWGEGFGKTPLEAMACGAALVTTDNGGSRDFAHDGETALVSAPGDPIALSANVLSLLGDDERRIGLAMRGQRLASGFTWDRSVRALAAVLEDYVADGGSMVPSP